MKPKRLDPKTVAGQVPARGPCDLLELGASVRAQAERSRVAARLLARASSNVKNGALEAMAGALGASIVQILAANRRDLKRHGASLSEASRDRLRLDEERIGAMAAALREVAALPDPVGEVTRVWRRPNGLQVGRMRIPLGVIALIYESRPNITAEAAGLCLKSGNAVLLRGGSEAYESNRAIARCLQAALEQERLPQAAVQTLERTEHEAVDVLVGLHGLVDLVIPRGGEELVRAVTQKARVPVIQHYKGVCHVYVDATADLEMAESICVNAKVQRPGVCNAMETLLVDRAVAPRFLPRALRRFEEEGVSLRGCEVTRKYLATVKPATEEDWSAEYLAKVLAVRVVDGLEAAMEHIAQYGSNHTEAIVTRDYDRAQRFLREVDSSVVLVNASTRFSDGGELGLGAEIGISTSKLHAFGPMGLEELTTTKFFVQGSGQIRS
ncbi:MAG: glutamate-5-semialdehyde dehydrogenase [Acidobacteriota bacterium]